MLTPLVRVSRMGGTSLLALPEAQIWLCVLQPAPQFPKWDCFTRQSLESFFFSSQAHTSPSQIQADGKPWEGVRGWGTGPRSPHLPLLVGCSLTMVGDGWKSPPQWG